MSLGDCFVASMARIVSRTHLAFMSISGCECDVHQKKFYEFRHGFCQAFLNQVGGVCRPIARCHAECCRPVHGQTAR